MKTTRYDAIVIGSGQGGVPLAKSLATAGWKVALIEHQYIGGSCINYGCTPTKTMIASARVAHLVRRAKDYGVNSTFHSVDISRVIKRKQDIVESFRNGSRRKIKSTEGLSLYEGYARFVSEKTLEIIATGEPAKYIQAEIIVINTGASAVTPTIPGFEQVHTYDSTSIMEIEQLPNHLIVIGGGYIGLEFGQMFHRFGSKVTIVQRDQQLLSREDEDVAAEMEKILSNEGLTVLLNTTPTKITYDSKADLQLTVKDSKEEKTLTGSHLLVATGRQPNTEGLNLEATGLATDEKGFIGVNDQLETDVKGIYAIGDVKGGPAFTHISYDDFRILNKNLLHKGNSSITGRTVSYVVFTDPQLGRVGLTEREAKVLGYNIKIAKMPTSWVARAIETDETEGLMKAIIDAETGLILGAAILGVEGGEIMAVIQTAMRGKLSYTDISEEAFAHPTLAESLNNLFSAVDA